MVATGAWLETHDPGERKVIKLGCLLLENGETLPDVTIAYQTWGQLNAAKAAAGQPEPKTRRNKIVNAYLGSSAVARSSAR